MSLAPESILTHIYIVKYKWHGINLSELWIKPRNQRSAKKQFSGFKLMDGTRNGKFIHEVQNIFTEKIHCMGIKYRLLIIIDKFTKVSMNFCYHQYQDFSSSKDLQALAKNSFWIGMQLIISLAMGTDDVW